MEKEKSGEKFSTGNAGLDFEMIDNKIYRDEMFFIETETRSRGNGGVGVISINLLSILLLSYNLGSLC